jgi:hypothetical protein
VRCSLAPVCLPDETTMLATHPPSPPVRERVPKARHLAHPAGADRGGNLVRPNLCDQVQRDPVNRDFSRGANPACRKW